MSYELVTIYFRYMHTIVIVVIKAKTFRKREGAAMNRREHRKGQYYFSIPHFNEIFLNKIHPNDKSIRNTKNVACRRQSSFITVMIIYKAIFHIKATDCRVSYWSDLLCLVQLVTWLHVSDYRNFLNTER